MKYIVAALFMNLAFTASGAARNTDVAEDTIIQEIDCKVQETSKDRYHTRGVLRLKGIKSGFVYFLGIDNEQNKNYDPRICDLFEYYREQGTALNVFYVMIGYSRNVVLGVHEVGEGRARLFSGKNGKP